ncbi:MAG: hypothetical protein ACK5N8_08155 [Alphaproteobacteria bacterium]
MSSAQLTKSIITKDEVLKFMDVTYLYMYRCFEVDESEKDVKTLVQNCSKKELIMSDNQNYLVRLSKQKLIIYYQMEKTHIISFDLKKNLATTNTIYLKNNKKLRLIIFGKKLIFDDSSETFSRQFILTE